MSYNQQPKEEGTDQIDSKEKDKNVLLESRKKSVNTTYSVSNHLVYTHDNKKETSNSNMSLQRRSLKSISLREKINPVIL